MIRRYFYYLIFFTGILLLSACSGNRSTFTPVVIEAPTATQQVEGLPENDGITETEPAQAVIDEDEIIDEDIRLSVLDFPDPTNYEWSEIASGFSRPLGMTTTFDEFLLMYVLEQNGLIRIVENGVVLDKPFLDISDKISTRGSEQGLLGIALDPNYLTNGIFYLNYTDRSGDTVIAKYLANQDLKSALANTEKIILTYKQPYSNHNGGNLVFGPDGFLYVGLGDGGSGGDPEQRSQNPNTLLGKMLRIAVQDQEMYAIPPDNPFHDGDGRAEIWAIGLRNPWRYSFDRLTGDLWIADVGQGNWEEINFTPAESEPILNYGWHFREGTHEFRGTPPNPDELIDPVYEYDHSLGCSVTGGYVYRGEILDEWYGIYIFGDFCNGNIWGLLPDAEGDWKAQLLFETSLNISSFGEDVFGEIYMIA
ncbi:MAG TPA: PQQ-dependent sugar dehydrogenase, partial [Anaerolineaceae bacterium]|nr:PQQ-dependent sugar dehydrogenase [Anaerolineaceae bacterium]